jgi:eukaryotic-like serine/threonine-protein kinase
MSPEQIRSPRDVDKRTDIWSLGTVLYELLTGQRPFQGETPLDVCAKVISAEPQTPSALGVELPSGLEEVLKRCMVRSQEARFQTVAELAQALVPFAPPSAVACAQRIQHLVESPARTEIADSDFDVEESSEGVRQRRRRRRQRWLIGGTAVASVIALAAVLLWPRRSQEPPALPAATIAEGSSSEGRTGLNPAPVPPAAEASAPSGVVATTSVPVAPAGLEDNSKPAVQGVAGAAATIEPEVERAGQFRSNSNPPVAKPAVPAPARPRSGSARSSLNAEDDLYDSRY